MTASSTTLRLAVWSGPRNISTAFMRAWENRPDTVVVDEPLYAHYLHVTKREHPGRDEVMAAQPIDWKQVVPQLTKEIPSLPSGETPRIYYQKHMSHHLLPEIDRQWLEELTHVFLVRSPRAMMASLAKRIGAFELEETGLPQQVELYRYLRSKGTNPPVIDAKEVLLDPERTMRLLCERLGVAFLPEMLSWPAGARDSDGVWAPHWYDQVWKSTGFGPYREHEVELPRELESQVEAAEALYHELKGS